jgi:hypothetical protein
MNSQLQRSEQDKHERQWKRQNDGPKSKSDSFALQEESIKNKFYNCVYTSLSLVEVVPFVLCGSL